MTSPVKRSPTSSLESPSKRRRLITSHDIQPISISRSYSLPATPSSRHHHSESLFTPSSSYASSTKTHYPTYPVDSPTNPFGRKRSLLPQLPPPTKFNRHVVLRFQLFRRGIEAGIGKDRSEGVYRIVQVPLAYTFQHLKELIGFLFGGEQEQEQDEDGQGQEEEEHLFEIRRDVEMCTRTYRRGKIKKSRVETRLSSSRDPYRWKTEWDTEFDADSFFGATQEQDEDEDAEGEDDDEEEEIDELDEEIKWEAEEDLTLAHVWVPPNPPSASESDEDEGEDNDTSNVEETRPTMPSVAIVYFHISAQVQTQIHITLNDEPLPPHQRRRGKGNAPYVFKARGRVSLSPRNEEDDAQEDYTRKMSTKLWNKPGDAFEKYLERSITLKMPSPIYRHAVSSSTSLISTPGLTTDDVDFSSSPALPKSSPFPSSSPFISRSYSSPSSLFSPQKSRGASLFSSVRKSARSLFSSSSTSPRKRPLFPTQTPALPPAQRKRMAYIKKRIERSKEKTRHRNRSRKKVEDEAELEVGYEELVDQLDAELDNDDDEDEKDKEKEHKGKIRMGDGRYLTVREAMLEVGDEQEV